MGATPAGMRTSPALRPYGIGMASPLRPLGGRARATGMAEIVKYPSPSLGLL